jgi:hypothetical protein
LIEIELDSMMNAAPEFDWRQFSSQQFLNNFANRGIDRTSVRSAICANSMALINSAQSAEAIGAQFSRTRIPSPLGR